MNVAVIGAGVGALTAAIALRRIHSAVRARLCSVPAQGACQAVRA